MKSRKPAKFRLCVIGLCAAMWAGSGCVSENKGEPGMKGGLSASIRSETSRLRTHEGGSAEVVLRLKNRGKEEWASAGRNPFYISYHLLNR